MTEADDGTAGSGAALPRRKLSPAAERALAEAAARRAAAQATPAPKPPKEVPERPELEPTRYGDWEKKGIASDF
jgi:hypothetical protein